MVEVCCNDCARLLLVLILHSTAVSLLCTACCPPYGHCADQSGWSYGISYDTYFARQNKPLLQVTETESVAQMIDTPNTSTPDTVRARRSTQADRVCQQYSQLGTSSLPSGLMLQVVPVGSRRRTCSSVRLKYVPPTPGSNPARTLAGNLVGMIWSSQSRVEMTSKPFRSMMALKSGLCPRAGQLEISFFMPAHTHME